MSDEFKDSSCIKCDGECCHGGVYILKSEYSRLPSSLKAKLKCESFMNGYRMNDGKCCFKSKKGCLLPEKFRFLDCKLYPLQPADINGNLIVNEATTEKNCIGLKNFDTEKHRDNCSKLLKSYIMKGLFTQKDIDSIEKCPYNGKTIN